MYKSDGKVRRANTMHKGSFREDSKLFFMGVLPSCGANRKSKPMESQTEFLMRVIRMRERGSL